MSGFVFSGFFRNCSSLVRRHGREQLLQRNRSASVAFGDSVNKRIYSSSSSSDDDNNNKSSNNTNSNDNSKKEDENTVKTDNNAKKGKGGYHEDWLKNHTIVSYSEIYSNLYFIYR